MMRILSLALLAATLCVNACGSEAPVKIPAPAFDPPAVAGKLQTAVVAGGCFWGVQGVYQHLKASRACCPVMPVVARRARTMNP